MEIKINVQARLQRQRSTLNGIHRILHKAENHVEIINDVQRYPSHNAIMIKPYIGILRF